MNKNIKELAPQAVWSPFAEICAIPHPSHHEEKIRSYLVGKAKEYGLECLTDAAGNVIMRKPATPGMENRKGIVLQAHMEMVPQKNGDKRFDFTADPIEAYVDGDWVKADGTTLGSDNGMGMAAILAVMGSKTLKHGPLEALITATEETGMDGAFGLEPGLLKGDILLNLDSETEGELYVGCAGGLDATAVFAYTEEKASAGYKAFKLEVSSLKGGHSGIDIILERGNANKILCRLMRRAQAEFGLRLASVNGGGLRNAIPREASAFVLVPETKAEAFVRAVEAYQTVIKDELKGVDDAVSITAAVTQMPGSVIDAGTQRRLLDAVQACPNGVMRMSPSMKGLVQTSTNLARVVSGDGKISVQCLLRSSCNTEKDDLGQQMAALFELAGAELTLSGSYDGWNPNMDSPILKTMSASYERLFGHKPAVMAIHAGLECGILGGKYPGLDMISFGPTIRHPHSPDEKVNIPSVERFWNYLTATLENAPAK